MGTTFQSAKARTYHRMRPPRGTMLSNESQGEKPAFLQMNQKGTTTTTIPTIQATRKNAAIAEINRAICAGSNCEFCCRKSARFMSWLREWNGTLSQGTAN